MRQTKKKKKKKKREMLHITRFRVMMEINCEGIKILIKDGCATTFIRGFHPTINKTCCHNRQNRRNPMVRLKSRYILFEVLYPDVDDEYETVPDITKKDILTTHHKVSPNTISPRNILQELRKQLQVNFGDYGLGKATALLQIKYFSNRTSTGIIRCGHDDHQYVIMALALMNQIESVGPIIMNPIKVSGTIKKVELFAIRRSHRLNRILLTDDRNDEFSSITDDENND